MPLHTHEKFGDLATFCEPAWYHGRPTPYYTENHVNFRKACRDFVEKEMKPYVDEWIEKGMLYPKNLHIKAFEAGIQGILYPKEYGGTKPDDFDAFYELILWDEMARVGGGGVLGQMGINSMALPPIMHFGNQKLKDLVLKDVIQGRKFCSLMISEPLAGSDVANIKTTAELKGDHYVLNGQKKWITGGLMADYFTCLARTGAPDSSAMGLSLFLLDKNFPGIKVRKMPTMMDNTHNTTFVILNDVKVPKDYLIGKENQGFKYIMINFNHERFVIAAAVVRMCRMCYQEAFHEANKRIVFGRKLIDNGVIRWKLGEMARQIEALQDHIEKVAFYFSSGVPDFDLGSECALMKVQATKTFEYCAREAVQIFGGSGVVREGRGKIVERLYREVRGQAIPGGSEEILLDMAIRTAMRKQAKL
eukprot:maker-scaffold_40-snap-gene-1.50-mRNA-1 protein AED:0.18 eAED:0.18 QI:96/1/1/1/1/1/2/175/418